MPSHRSQAQFQWAKWRLLILAPFWVFQLALALTIAGIFSYRLGECLKSPRGHEKDGLPRQLEIGWTASSIALSSLGALCTLAEIARYLGEALTARFMLFTHAIKVVCAGVLLGLDVAVYIKGAANHYSLVGLGLDTVLLLTALSLAAYSIRVYRRANSFEDYPHTVNAKSYGFHDEQQEHDTAYLGAKDILPTIERRVSSATSRLSLSSSRSGGDQQQQQPAVVLEPVRRTPSHYSHERDTQFDEYLARRMSTRSSPRVDGAARQSWGSPLLEPLAYDEAKQQQHLAGRPRAVSASRAPSWTSDQILVAVPEEDEATREERDRETLLGGERRSSMGDEVRLSQDIDPRPKW